MTAVRLQPALVLPSPEIAAHIAVALTHRPDGPLDYCSACGFHHPCPAYFGARHALLAADVHPALWAR